MRHVALHGHVARGAALRIAHGRDDRLLLEERAVLAPVDELRHPGLARREGAPHGRVEGGTLDAALQESRVAADRLGTRVARDALEGRVDVLDRAVGIGDDDRLGRLLDGRSQTGPLGLGTELGRQVLADHEHARDRPGGVTQRRGPQIQGETAAVPRQAPLGTMVDRLAPEHARPMRLVLGFGVLAHGGHGPPHDLARRPAEQAGGGGVPARDYPRPIERVHGQGIGVDDRFEVARRGGEGRVGADECLLVAPDRVRAAGQHEVQGARRHEDEGDALGDLDDVTGGRADDPGSQHETTDDDPGDGDDGVGGRQPARLDAPTVAGAVRSGSAGGRVPLRVLGLGHRRPSGCGRRSRGGPSRLDQNR